MDFSLRIGTRGSPLALAQAHMTKAAFIRAHGVDDEAIEIVTVKTTGDRVQDRPLAEIGGKALWTKELDGALIDGTIDCAVHSMKDVETIRPAQIAIAAILPRADMRDRLIGADNIEVIPQGARLGTSSPRRAAQMLSVRPDLNVETLRGNVATRLAAIESGAVDVTLLAAAGLDRLGRGEVGAALSPETLLPAAQQGAVGIEVLAERSDLRTAFAAINDTPTHICVSAERAFLAALGADCHSPVAALAQITQSGVWLRAQLLTNDGQQSIAGEIVRDKTSGDAAGKTLATDLLARASDDIRVLFAG